MDHELLRYVARQYLDSAPYMRASGSTHTVSCGCADVGVMRHTYHLAQILRNSVLYPPSLPKNTQIVLLSRLKALSRVTVARFTTASRAQSLCCLSGCARQCDFLRGVFQISSSPRFLGISGVPGEPAQKIRAERSSNPCAG